MSQIDISRYMEAAPAMAAGGGADGRSLCEHLSSGDIRPALASAEVARLTSWAKDNQNTLITVAAAYGLYRFVRR